MIELCKWILERFKMGLEVIKPILDEIKDGRKTYSVSGFALFSNTVHLPSTIPEWTELFNLGAAIVAFILVSWRLGHKFLAWKKERK